MRRFRPQELFGRPTSMTVGASHIAQFDFGLDVTPVVERNQPAN
jgi:hypothetical protein